MSFLISSNFKFLIFSCLYFLLFLTCGTNQQYVTKSISGEIEFQLEVKNLPEDLKKEKLEFILRYYFCEVVTSKNCYSEIQIEKFPANSFITKFISKPPLYFTHISIELSGIQKVHGKFSPGHNPHWPTINVGVENKYFHSFNFRTQENLIPDAKQFELANQFSPILVFSKNKKYLPSNLEKYGPNLISQTYPLPDKDIRKKSIGKTSWNYLSFPEQTNDPNDTHLYYHVRYAKSFVSGTESSALPGFRDDKNYWVEIGNGDMVVSYWIWYDMNEGPTKYGNVHQGDLESYSILVSKNGQPKRILLTGHDHVLLDTSFNNINSLKNHPILYVASGNMGADGGNPTSAYGDYTVKLHAGNFLFNWISDPWDVFPKFDPNSAILFIPENISIKDLANVKIGSGKEKETVYVDARPMVRQSIKKLVAWEEPGWIGEKAFQDPDGHHRVDPNLAFLFKFEGRLGKHPRKVLKWSELKQYGESPENAPFKTNIEQHFSFESPRMERNHTDREGNYGPKFIGDESTPQK